MNARRRSDRRRLVAVAALVLMSTVLPAQAGHARQSAPSVHVSVDDDAGVVLTRACDGSVQAASNAIVFALATPDLPPASPVTISWSGSLATDGGTKQYDGSIDALPSEVVLDPSTGDAYLGMFVTRGGDLTLTIEPGDGYTVGTPASATATLTATTVTLPCPTTPTPSTPSSVEPLEFGSEPPPAVPLAAPATYTG